MTEASPDAPAAAPLSASLEDYLETIYCIVQQRQVARPKDIVRATGVNNSSVTGALRLLAQQGLIHYAPYELVTLTAAGQRAARDIRSRHQALRTFFADILGVAEADAEAGACRMEHTIPRPVLDRLLRFIEFLRATPDATRGLLARFQAACAEGDAPPATPLTDQPRARRAPAAPRTARRTRKEPAR